MEAAPSLRRCRNCTAQLPAGATAELCPACGMAAASSQSSQLTGEELTAVSPLSGSSATLDRGPRLAAGQVFGPYRIGRLLGRGGMGEVYEADHVEQGRRVALKVLNQRLADPDDRARFLREGRLAAAINHPNSVYIFGSEEVLGTPVIAMELLPGGTLKDRVKERGPLPPAEAVDAILQVLAGLETANAAGILHRDVKPANCFMDRDGAVKIGDFGLSISSMARDVSQVTTIGTFQGTPQFASPEQIRGEPLDVRADIYSVGATLYYLLTGQPPFDDKDLLALLTRIATERPKSPRELRPKIPKSLATLVLRCLSKDRATRPATYISLDEELRPFSSAAPTPGTLARRFGAWLIDFVLLFIPMGTLTIYYMVSRSLFRGGQMPTWLFACGPAVQVSYYGFLEGLWGASLGKWLVGLRVVGPDRQPPGLTRGLWRAALFAIPSVLAILPFLVIGQQRVLLYDVQHQWANFTMSVAIYVLLASLFLTARRRNGFAGLHELLSRTRVIQRLGRSTSAVLDIAEDAATPTEAPASRVGPYDILGSIGTTGDGELLVGYDPSLRRKVWIHHMQPGAPPLPSLARDLSRPTRLRWLSGRRTASEAWDAYEALDGMPLLVAAARPQPWRRTKLLLLGLSREIDTGLKDGSLTTLALDHVWVTHDGRAKLLDFRAPGVLRSAEATIPATAASGQVFLAAAARSAKPVQRLPLSAEALIVTLERRGYSSSQQIVADVAALIPRADEIARWRRVVPVVICTVIPVIFAVATMAGMRMMQQMMSPERQEMVNDLTQMTVLSKKTGADAEQQRAALEVYVASRFGKTLADGRTWTDPMLVAALGRFRPLALRVVADYPHVSAEELTKATATLQPFLEKQRKQLEAADPAKIPRLALLAACTVFTLVPMVLFGLLWAFVFRGGLFLRVFGVAVATSAGMRASRLRALWRGLIAWTPPIAIGFALFRVADASIGDTPHSPAPSEVLLAASVAVWVVGVLWMTLRPERGLQDRLAGTWLVPR